MGLKRIYKIQSPNKILNRIQDLILDRINELAGIEILDGLILKEVSIPTGSTLSVEHKLGRNPLGYVVIKRDANSNIWETSIDDKFLNLNSSANVIVSLWVF